MDEEPQPDCLAKRVLELLATALQPSHLWIEDESAAHVGHAGARAGGRHLRVRIVSSCFEGKRIIERHRMVFDALRPFVGREIHALALETLTPAQLAGRAAGQQVCACSICSGAV
ncbi:MAG: hypothetical protein KatS3mg077_2368 [Candidatus Binatia bacterium]|nr:MAG: hypothetical protein KatS3mg077_2368 [Candidatus Binatia bacterium]